MHYIVANLPDFMEAFHKFNTVNFKFYLCPVLFRLKQFCVFTEGKIRHAFHLPLLIFCNLCSPEFFLGKPSVKQAPYSIFDFPNQQEWFSELLKLFGKVACRNNTADCPVVSPDEHIIMINHYANRRKQRISCSNFVCCLHTILCGGTRALKG